MDSQVYINPKLSPELLSEPSPDLDAELTPKLDAELNINSSLPPELLTSIFHFLPISDLNNALLVCRLAG